MVKRLKSTALIMAVSLVVGSLIGCTSKVDTNTASKSEATKVVITDKEELDAIADIRQKLDFMYERGANLKLVMSDDSSDDWYLMYNKNKDCYAEMTGGGAVVYQPGGERTVFTSNVTSGKDLDPLALINNMLILTEEGIGTIEVSQVDSITGLEVNNEAGSMEKEVESIASDEKESAESIQETDNVLSTESQEIEGSSAEDSTDSNKEVEESAISESSEENIENTVAVEDITETQEEKGEVLNQYVITIKGLENIKKIYSKTIDSGSAEEVVASILGEQLTNKDSNKNEYMYTLTVNTKDENAISVRLTLTMDNIEYIGWWFDGFIDIGDWNLPEGWNGEHTEDEWVDLYNKLKENIQTAIDNYAKSNFTEDQINEMKQAQTIEETSADLSESQESVDGSSEEIEAGEPESFKASINRDESFNDKVQALLEKDGISEDAIDTFEIPEGFTQEDKDKMVELYGVIKEWDKNQATGVLVSPIEMSDIEFISSYLDACKKGYSEDVKSSEVDKYGAIFWEDTLGTFIKMLQ